MFKSHPENRRTCATCGQEDVMHTTIGFPFAAHLKGRRHREAVEREGMELVHGARAARISIEEHIVGGLAKPT